jgi:hypothetical protein
MSTDISRVDIALILKRANSASPEPWEADIKRGVVDGMAPDKVGGKLTELERHTIVSCSGPIEVRMPNTLFIAHARTDVVILANKVLELLDKVEEDDSENSILNDADDFLKNMVSAKDAEIERLVEVLKFYAHDDNWFPQSQNDYEPSLTDLDLGAKAKDVLEKEGYDV